MTPTDARGIRLALFTDTALPQLNGVTRTLDRLVQTVRSRGGEVLTLTTTDDDAVGDPAVRRFASAPFWAYPQLRLALPPLIAATRELRAFRPTLVHAATPFGVGIAGRAAALKLGVPLVTSYHTSFTAYAEYYGLGALAGPGWGFLRWFHNSGVHTYCPTRAVQRELRGQGMRNVRIWGRGVDTSRFSPSYRSTVFRAERLGVDDDTIVVAYVGRLAAEKGLDLALEAMQEACARTARRLKFVFAGDGPHAERCRQRAPEGSVFLGRIEGAELAACYASADLFVFPSCTDTFGNVLLESMASGVPIIAANAASSRELLRDGETGMLVDGRTAMGAAIAALADDPGRRRLFAARGLDAARERSWEVVFDRLLADYRKAVAVCSPRPLSVPASSRQIHPFPTIGEPFGAPLDGGA